MKYNNSIRCKDKWIDKYGEVETWHIGGSTCRTRHKEEYASGNEQQIEWIEWKCE